MINLMIVIDGPLSKKNGFLTVKGYYSKKYTVNKEGRYVGTNISEADLFECLDVENINNEYVRQECKKVLVQIGFNSFYLADDNIENFIDVFLEFGLIFIDNMDKRLFRLYQYNENVELSKKTKYNYQVGNSNLHYDKGILSYSKSGSHKIEYIEPSARLFFDYEEKSFQLFFLYGKTDVAAFDKKNAISDFDRIYLRNYSYELVIEGILLKHNFLKLLKNKYKYIGNYNYDSLSVYLKKYQIDTLMKDELVIPQVNIKKEKDGWFELDLKYTLEDRLIDLSSRIQLFSDSGELNDGGKRIVLPNSIIEAKDSIVYKEEKMFINEENIVDVLRIIHESKKNVNEFFSFGNVKLNLPQKNMESAYNYQLEGIRWLKYLSNNHWGGCLADDMGLGKTFQIISFLSDYDVRKKIEKVLIIAPKSLLSNWKREFNKFKSDFNIDIFHGQGRDKFDFEHNDIIITTYNTASIDVNVLNRQSFTYIIFDEIQVLKNRQSEMSKNIKRIKSKSRIGLSGTPMENNLSELWNIMDIINPGILGNYKLFSKKYGTGNLAELKTILDLFILRRMKKNVMKELPKKTTEIVYCDMDVKQRELYEAVTIAVKNAIESMKAFSAPIVLKGLTLLRQCCCHPLLLPQETNVDNVIDSCKLESLSILLKNLYLSDHKVLIFSNYTSMLRLIWESLNEDMIYGDNIFYLDGTTKNRSEIVDNFESSEKGIFLISLKAGGVGLNLVSAQDVIIFDPWWNPFAEEQAIDRAYRIGQENNVHVFKFVVADSIEERILEMQNEKLQKFDEIINGISTDKNIDLKEILALL